METPNYRATTLSARLDRDVVNVTNASSAAAASSAQHPVVADVITAVLIGVTWPTCVSLNCLVCVVIYRSRRLQSTTNHFITSLAVSDLCVALFVAPFLFVTAVVSPLGNVYVCKLSRYVQSQAVTASVYVLVAICADRYYTIVYPLSFRVTRTRAKLLCLGSWLVAALLAAPVFYFYDVIHDEGRAFCRWSITDSWQGVIYATFVVNVAFVVPVATLIVGYAKLSRYIWTFNRRSATFQRTSNLVPRCKVKTVKMIIIMTVVTISMTLPYVIMQLCRCQFVNGTNSNGSFGRHIFAYCLVTYFATGVCKPLLYMFSNANFRRGCKEIFCMSAMKCYRLNAYAITGSSQFAKRNYVGVWEGDVTSGHARAADAPAKTFDRAARLAAGRWQVNKCELSTCL